MPPVLIDLCSIAIFHRFSSPAWWDSVAKRVCADVSNEQGFTQVVKLKVSAPRIVTGPDGTADACDISNQTGQALVLCPSGLGLFWTTRKTASGAVVQGKPKLAHFGRRYLIIKTRKRITVDGGVSRMALDG